MIQDTRTTREVEGLRKGGKPRSSDNRKPYRTKAQKLIAKKEAVFILKGKKRGTFLAGHVPVSYHPGAQSHTQKEHV